MTTDQDAFKRAAKRFLVDLGNEREATAVEVNREEEKEATDDQVFEDEAETVDLLEPDVLSGDVEEAVGLLEDDRLGGDRLREGVALLELDGSGEDVAEHAQEEGPEKEIITIKVDGEDHEVEAYRYPNGSARDIETGRFLAPPNPNVFEDPEKARAAIITRHDRVLEQAREGLVKGVNRSGEHDVETPAEAWAAIVEEQTVLAMGDKRGSTASARLVGSATKMIGEEKEQPKVNAPGGVVVVTDFQSILLSMFNRLHPGDPELALVEMKKYRDSLR